VSELTFPWPHKTLSPNARGNWRTKEGARVAAKLDGFSAVKNSGLTVPEKVDLQVTYTFYPPDNRRRDLDNLISQMKPTQDGIFQALETDDSRVKRVIGEWGVARAGGCVVVRIAVMAHAGILDGIRVQAEFIARPDTSADSKANAARVILLSLGGDNNGG
jgi:crossover junction endodeoxyribonuclease RusA